MRAVNVRAEKIIAYLLVLTTLFYITGLADPISQWHQRSPLPTGYDIYDVAFGNGKFVAVGYGPVITSSNGITWEVENGPVDLFKAVFGNGVFVVIPWHHTVCVSKDGVQWSSFPVPIGIQGIGFCNGMFVGAGYDLSASTLTIISSPDGTNWSHCSTIQSDNANTISQVMYGGGRYIASDWVGNLFISTNLLDWSVRASGINNGINSICYGNGLYVAVGPSGGAYVSKDTVNWTHRGSSDRSEER